MLCKKQENRTAACGGVSFGDGGTGSCFYESLNFAALRKLPILYVCENNRFAMHTPLEKRWATERLCERVATFGIKAHQFNDDIFKLREAVADILTDIRQGCGPVFIECLTHRWLEHIGPADDDNNDFHYENEYQIWKENDQINRLGKMLDEKTRDRINQEVETAIQAAEEFAEKSSYPAAEELYTHVYAH